MRKIKPEKVDALRTLVTGAVGSDDNAEEVAYLENQSPVSKADIDAKYAEMLAEWDAQEYARNRKAEYDALNQLELMSDDSINGTTTHKDAIVAIKAKWPKDNSGPV